MNLDDLHIKIKEFLGDLSASNYKKHEIGSIKAFSFIRPKCRVILGTIFISIKFNEKFYSEEEFVHLLNLKAFW